jgi:asparagine synthase (glutamine-hydrolysing)
MCGIAGLVGVDRSTAAPRVREALRRLEHRGPDGEGIHESASAVIGMRRLAIIDLECGSQPIYNEDRSIAVVCNGELYNYIEGFAELRSRGHELQSGSDVNLLPHLYEEQGQDAFVSCRGMFAAAIWDDRRRRLTIGRDRAGKKPLFWARVGDGLAFASELPALLALLDDTPPYDPRAIGAFLQLAFIPHPSTVYQGVFALPPGCALSFTEGSDPSISRYWRAGSAPPFKGSRDEAIALLEEKLREAVRIRLRSDVPVGLFLSGGVDSGLVAAYASELGARDLTCFVVEVRDQQLNEAPAARAVASHLGLPVQTIELDFAPQEAIERIATLYGQPFGDSSAVPSYFVSRAARAHRKVVLNGDGGDEIFGGYRRYWMGRAAPAVSRIPRPLLTSLAALGRRLARRNRRSVSGFAARALRGVGTSDPERYLMWTGDLLADRDLARLFPGLAAGPAASIVMESGRELSTASMRDFQLADYQLILADGLVTKMDIATMANSIEARSPFLDVPLAEFAWSLPEEWLLTWRETKPLLRELARRRIPEGVARAPKRGFEVPVARWLGHELRDAVGDLLLAPDSRVAGYGSGERIRDFVRGDDDFPGNRAQTIWCMLMLEIFLRAPVPEVAGRAMPSGYAVAGTGAL